MATDGNRYYWLRLKEDFFSSKRIKKLKSYERGDTYIIIYLKMQLSCIRKDGIIRYTGVEESFASEIALDIDENPEDVEFVINFLLERGLAESANESTLFLPYAVENTGSESTSAQRVRNYREKAKALHCNTSETQVKRVGNVEIEKEIEIEKELDITEAKASVCRTKDVRRIVEAWNSLGLQQLTKVTGTSKRGGMLRARVNEYGVDAVLRAIENIRGSPFLKGQGERGWVITFEWFVKPNNFIKVLENNYEEMETDGRRSTNKPVSGKNSGKPESESKFAGFKYDN